MKGLQKDVKFETVKMKLTSGKIKEKAARELILNSEAEGWQLVTAMPIITGVFFKTENF